MFSTLVRENNILKSKDTELFNCISLSCLITTLKRNVVMLRNIASMLQTKVLRTNDSGNAVLNNNQVPYNNPTSVVETNSSEKEKTNAQEQQGSGSNDSQSVLYRYLKISILRKMLVNQILISEIVLNTAKELRLSKPQSSATPDVKKSNESKLVS